IGIERRNPAREFGPIQVTDPDHLTGRKTSFATRHPWREQALAPIAQSLFGPLINEQRPFGMMKERYPAFAPLQPGGLRNEQRALGLALHDPSQGLLFTPGRDDQWNSGPNGDLRRLNLGGHAPDGCGAVGAAGHAFYRTINLFDAS